MEPRSAYPAWILESLSSGVVAIDESARVTLLNGGAGRVLGVAASEALGRDCREALAAQPAVVRLLLDTLGGAAPLSRAELALDAADGDARTIGFTLCAVRGPAGEPRGAAILFRDLAPIERMDERQRLRERLAALGEMAAGMAHEIRNPLAAMEVMAGLLRRRLADRPEEADLVTRIVRELRRVAAAVTDGLDFVRPAALERAPVAVAGLVDEALTLAAARVPCAGELRACCPADLPPLLADPEKLRAVLVDLVVNALEAVTGAGAPPQPSVRVTVALGRRDAGADPVRVAADGAARDVVVTVADNGPGIPDELRERVFYPFFTTKEKGSGVGLANAQKVVVAHGGSVELDASPDGGCTVRLRLPAADGAPRESAAA